MGEEKLINSLFGSTVREVVNKANELKLKKEDIISVFVLRDQIFLIYITK